MKAKFDFESIKNKAIEQLKAGKPLLGKDGTFAPLLESILNAALGYTPYDLYHKYSWRLSSSDTESDKKQGRVP